MINVLACKRHFNRVLPYHMYADCGSQLSCSPLTRITPGMDDVKSPGETPSFPLSHLPTAERRIAFYGRGLSNTI